MNFPIPAEQVLAIFGSGMVVAIVLGGIGSAFSKTVFPDGVPRSHQGLAGWRMPYRRTLRLHGALLGVLVGVVGFPTLPVPEFLGAGILAHVLWYAMWGVLSNVVHDRVVDFVDGDNPPEQPS